MDQLWSITPMVVWLLSAMVLMLIELATPGVFFFISFAFGALFGALAAALNYSLMVQCSIALLVSVIQFFSMRRTLKRFTNSTHTPTNVHALVGQRGIVVQPLAPGLLGQVKIGGERWAAESQEKIKAQTWVQVLRIAGNRVIVKSVPSEMAAPIVDTKKTSTSKK